MSKSENMNNQIKDLEQENNITLHRIKGIVKNEVEKSMKAIGNKDNK